MLIDTSGLLCLLDKADFRHDIAAQFFNQSKYLVTTNYVLAEFVPLSQTRGLRRSDSLEFLIDFCNLPRLGLVWIDEDLHNAGFELLQNRLDKTYSLCDALSFVIMREREISEALTTDKHFKQEGFIKLLES
ncbi:MAG: PIN domain-containing protein [Actinomycetota bacterium]